MLGYRRSLLGGSPPEASVDWQRSADVKGGCTMSTQRTWDPFSEMLSLRDAMGQLLEGSFVRPGASYAAAQAGYSFPLNVHGTSDELTVEALLPGVSQEDVN